MRTRASVVAAVAVALAGCAGIRGLAGGGENSRLRVQLTSLTVEHELALIRGVVTSDYDQRVDGVRYVVTVRDKANPETVLERYERRAETTVIEPGGQAPVRLDIESTSFGDRRFRIALVASPLALGGRAVAAPSD